MTATPSSPAALTPEQHQELVEFARLANTELETTVQQRTNQAFNTGCAVPFVPVVIVALAAGLLSRSVVALAIWLMLGVLGMMAFALYVAYRAKINATETTFNLHVQPAINRKLRELDLDDATFRAVAGQTLPEQALLRKCLQLDPSNQTGNQEAL